MKKFGTAAIVLATFVNATLAAENWGMKQGAADLKSADVLAFGPGDVLFIGDTKTATVFALGTGDETGDPAAATFNLPNLSQMLSDMLGGIATVNDIVANPANGNLFVACTSNDRPAIVRITNNGRTMSGLNLSDIMHSSVVLSDAPEDKVTGQGRRQKNRRTDAITDLAYFEGKLLISGLRASGAPSSVREIDFPFAAADKGVGVQIYHAAHGKEEDYSAMRTFVPLMIDGEPSLLGAYVCTPLVKFPLKDIGSGTEKVKATTVAELGNRNRPLDMVSYSKDGSEFLLLSNSARGVMKITTAGLSDNAGLTQPVRGGGHAGQAFETVAQLQGIVQMTKLNDAHAVVLIDNDGQLDLKTVALP